MAYLGAEGGFNGALRIKIDGGIRDSNKSCEQNCAIAFLSA
jgi:hypothetical protein